jgi:hypothetical protein
VDKRALETFNPIVILTGPLTKLVELEPSRGFRTEENFLEDHPGMNGRGEVPTRTDRDNAASLC